jgi:hypothetical protein
MTAKEKKLLEALADSATDLEVEGNYLSAKRYRIIISEVEASQAGEVKPIAQVVRNSAGQISIFDPDGDLYVGCNLFTAPPNIEALCMKVAEMVWAYLPDGSRDPISVMQAIVSKCLQEWEK